MHFIGSPAIRMEGDVAQVDTYCVAHHVSSPTRSNGRPTSSLVCATSIGSSVVSGTWLIAKRVCAFDWTYTLELDAGRSFPFLEDFTVGHRDRSDITYAGV